MDIEQVMSKIDWAITDDYGRTPRTGCLEKIRSIILDNFTPRGKEINRICECGHKDNRHADIDDGTKHGNWGAGKCELCGCTFFNELAPRGQGNKKKYSVLFEENGGEYYGKMIITCSSIHKLSDNKIEADGVVIELEENIVDGGIKQVEAP